jgi:hypothetical protein
MNDLMAAVVFLGVMFGVTTGSTVASAAEITGVKIQDVSSEDSKWKREAIHAMDGSGLNDDDLGIWHSAESGGNMWLAFSLPASVTLDLGSYYDLDRLHVWNYCEAQCPDRSAKTIEIWVALEPDADFVQLDADPKVDGIQPFTLVKPTETRNFGQAIDLNSHAATNDVRRVRLVITDNYANPGSGGGTGLSEIRFYGAVLPTAETRFKGVEAREQERLRQIALAKQRRADAARADYLQNSAPGRPPVERFLEFMERRNQTLEEMAADNSINGAMARLYLNKDVDEANRILESADFKRYDWHAHFSLIGLHNMFNADDGSRGKLMSREATAKLEAHFWDTLKHKGQKPWRVFHFMPDEPWWTWGTPNHGFVFQSYFYGVASILKNIPEYADQFNAGEMIGWGQGAAEETHPELAKISLAEYAERGREFWRNKLEWHARQGLWAEDSVYRCYDIAAAYHLALHVKDPVIRQRASMLLDLHWLIYAMHMVDDQLGGAMNRFKPHFARNHFDRGLGSYYFGGPGGGLHSTEVAMFGDYVPPRIAYPLQGEQKTRGCFTYRERLTNYSPETDQPPYSVKQSYITPEYILGSYRLQDLAHQGIQRYDEREFNGITLGQAKAMLRLGPPASFHGFHCMQHGPVLLARWYGAELAKYSEFSWVKPNEDIQPFITIVMRESGGAEIEPPTLEQGWLFGKAGDAWYALRPAAGAFAVGKASDHGELQRFTFPEDQDKKIPFIVHAGGVTQDGSFEKFKKNVLAGELSYENGVLTYKTKAWGAIQFAPYADQPADQWRQVNGKPVELPGKLFDSRYLNSDYNSGIITASFGDRKLILDFNKSERRVE